MAQRYIRKLRQLLHFLWGVPGGVLWDFGIICFLLRCLYVVIQRMNCFAGFAARRSLLYKKGAEIGNRKKNGNGEKGEERWSIVDHYLSPPDPRVPRRFTQLICLSSSSKLTSSEERAIARSILSRK